MADIYEAAPQLDAKAGFGLVFVTWGALMWLHGTAYFGSGPTPSDDPHDYADEAAVMVNSTRYVSLHTLGDSVTPLIDAGLRLEYLHEHDAVPWRMVEGLRADPDRMYRWPDRPWLPLAFSLSARRD